MHFPPVNSHITGTPSITFQAIFEKKLPTFNALGIVTEHQVKQAFPRRYKLLTDWKKNNPAQKNATLPGCLVGDLINTRSGIQLISQVNSETTIRPLNKAIHWNLTRSEKDEGSTSKPFLCTAYSKNTLAINRCNNNTVDFFETGDYGLNYQSKICFTDQIQQLHLRNEFLFVRVRDQDSQEKLLTYNIDSPLEKISECDLPSKIQESERLWENFRQPVIFGKTHFILVSEKSDGSYQLFAAPLSAITTPDIINPDYSLIGKGCSSFPHVFSEENHFIVITEENHQFKIERIDFFNREIKHTILANNLPLLENTHDLFSMHYQWGRLFAAYTEGVFSGHYHFVSYDIETGKKQNLLSSPAKITNFYLKARFVSDGPLVGFIAEDTVVNIDAKPLTASLVTYFTSFDYGAEVIKDEKAEKFSQNERIKV
jgi:hypothetical protein